MMRIRNPLLFVVLSLFTLLMAACVTPPATTPSTTGDTPAPAEDSTEAPAEDGLPSMALVLIGPKDDKSWAEAAYNALEAQAAKGAKTAYSESVSDADVARVMREY